MRVKFLRLLPTNSFVDGLKFCEDALRLVEDFPLAF